jgi:hypothetical protein
MVTSHPIKACSAELGAPKEVTTPYDDTDLDSNTDELTNL